jgi:hypothetical protein
MGAAGFKRARDFELDGVPLKHAARRPKDAARWDGTN